MKLLFATLGLAISSPMLAQTYRDASVHVDNQSDPWSCTNSLNAEIANSYNRCVLNGGRFVQSSITACQQGPHGWYGSSVAYCY